MPFSFIQIPDHPDSETAKSWIPIKSISHSLTLEVGKPEKGKARQVGRGEHGDFEFKKMMDRATSFLNIACSNGKMLSTLALAFSREDEKEVYLKIELKNVLIAEISYEIDDGSEPEETIKLNYESIVWKFRPKLKSGKLGDWIQSGWDRIDCREMTPTGSAS